MEDRFRLIAVLATWSGFLLNLSLYTYHEYYPDPFRLPGPLDEFVFFSSLRTFALIIVPIPGIFGTYYLHNNLIRFYGATMVVQTILMVFNITHLFDNARFLELARESFTNAMEHYTWRKWHSDKFEIDMETSIFNRYVDDIQFRFNCCGVRSYQDWTMVKPFYVHGRQLPEPCCSLKSDPQPLRGEIACNLEDPVAKALPGCGKMLTTMLLHRTQCETLYYCIYQIIVTSLALAYMHERRKQTPKYARKLINHEIQRARRLKESEDLEQEIRNRVQAMRDAEREQRESDIREVHEILRPGQYNLDIERLDDEEYMKEYEKQRADEFEKLKMIAKRTVIPESEVLRLDQAREALALNDYLRPIGKRPKKPDVENPDNSNRFKVPFKTFDRKPRLVKPDPKKLGYKLPGHKVAAYKIPIRMRPLSKKTRR